MESAEVREGERTKRDCPWHVNISRLAISRNLMVPVDNIQVEHRIPANFFLKFEHNRVHIIL